MPSIGEVHQKGADTFEWVIPKFSELLKKDNEWFLSPMFRLSDSRWFLVILPKGVGGTEFLLLQLMSLDLSAEHMEHCTLGIKRTDGSGEKMATRMGVYSRTESTKVLYEFNKRAEEYKEGEYLSSDTLTIACHLRIEESQNTTSRDNRTEGLDTVTEKGQNVRLNGSPEMKENAVADTKDDSDLQTLMTDLRRMFCDKKSCDVVLLSSDSQRFPAHKVILQARSSVFAEMFQHNMSETCPGEICIEDVQGTVLKQLLHYIYTDNLNDIASCDLPSLFAAAEKFDIPGLKKVCTHHLLRRMSPKNVCDAIVLGHTFKVQELTEAATSYLSKKASEVMESTFWKKFVKEHTLLAVEILKTVVLSQKV